MGHGSDAAVRTVSCALPGVRGVLICLPQSGNDQALVDVEGCRGGTPIGVLGDRSARGLSLEEEANAGDEQIAMVKHLVEDNEGLRLQSL